MTNAIINANLECPSTPRGLGTPSKLLGISGSAGPAIIDSLMPIESVVRLA